MGDSLACLIDLLKKTICPISEAIMSFAAAEIFYLHLTDDGRTRVHFDRKKEIGVQEAEPDLGVGSRVSRHLQRSEHCVGSAPSR